MFRLGLALLLLLPLRCAWTQTLGPKDVREMEQDLDAEAPATWSELPDAPSALRSKPVSTESGDEEFPVGRPEMFHGPTMESLPGAGSFLPTTETQSRTGAPKLDTGEVLPLEGTARFSLCVQCAGRR